MDPETRLLRIASRQYSVFTTGQALQAGMTTSMVRTRLKRGAWRSLHRGVHIIAGIAIGWEQKVMASCLACAPAAASHRSAAVVWGFATDLDVPHVTVRDDRRLERPGIIVHRSSSLVVATHRRFPVTPPMQTVIDVAGMSEVADLARILDEAQRSRRIDLRRLETTLAEPHHMNRPGSRILRTLIAERNPRRAVATDIETLFLDIVRTTNFPRPSPQHEVVTRRGTRYIDFAYPDAMLAIELDGLHHEDRRNRSIDRARQNDLEELGWHFRRFTWDQLNTDPLDVVFTLARALDVVPTRWGRARLGGAGGLSGAGR